MRGKGMRWDQKGKKSAHEVDFYRDFVDDCFRAVCPCGWSVRLSCEDLEDNQATAENVLEALHKRASQHINDSL